MADVNTCCLLLASTFDKLSGYKFQSASLGTAKNKNLKTGAIWSPVWLQINSYNQQDQNLSCQLMVIYFERQNDGGQVSDLQTDYAEPLESPHKMKSSLPEYQETLKVNVSPPEDRTWSLLIWSFILEGILSVSTWFKEVTTMTNGQKLR